MTDNPREPETQPAQSRPTADEAAVPMNYWEEAYEGLDQEVKDRVKKLKQSFDQETERAIKKLQKKTSDPEALEKLQHIENNYQCLDARAKGTLQLLDVRAKGRLQRLAWNAKKKLDDEAIRSISTIHEACKNNLNGDVGKAEGDAVSVDDLLQLCRERQELAKEKSWKFDFLGRQYFVHELWGTVFDKVDKLNPIMDLATSSEPTANVGWSVVKVILQFAVQGEKEAGAILTGIGTAVCAMERSTVYDRQIQEIGRRNAEGQTHIKAFEACLISTYSRILKFFSEAGACLQKNRVGIYWHAFWSTGDIVSFERDIFQFEQKLFQDSATGFLIDQGAMAKQVRDLLGAQNTRLTVLQDDLGALAVAAANQSHTAHHVTLTKVLGSLSDRIKEIQRREKEHRLATSRENMLGWWSSSKVEDHHKKPKDLRADKTGDWVFQKDEYKRWREADGPRLLWIKGIPGAGKTVLMSRIIDGHLESRANASHINDFQLAYSYCKWDAADRRFSHSIFRSFIRQLADGYHPLPEKMRRFYEEKSRPSSLSVELSHEEYHEVLLELIPRTTETILILDALDECIGDEKQPADNNEEMKLVLSMLQKLLNSGLPVKLIISSRYNSDIEARLGDQEMIEISSADNRHDILKMVEDNIDEYNKNVEGENQPIKAYNRTHPTSRKKLKPKIRKDLRNKMVQVFTDKSQGQFQWASMHIQYLLKGALRGPGEMGSELGKLPPDLTEAYHDFFKRIRLQSGSKPETAFRVFRWLLASKGSCDKVPLIAATCQKLKGDEPDLVEGDEAYVLNACQNLVITDGPAFRFSHLSVQEYCEKHRPELIKDCHYDVALVCVWMIFRYKTQDHAVKSWKECHHGDQTFSTVDKSQSESYDLWKFAANQWHNYFREITDEAQKGKIREVVLKSFVSDAPSVDSTIWMRLRAATITEAWRESLYTIRPTSIIMLALQPKNWANIPIRSHDMAFPGALVAIQAIVAGLLWKTRHLLHGYLAGEAWLEDVHRELTQWFSAEWVKDLRRKGKPQRREPRWHPALRREFTDVMPSSLFILELVNYRVQEEEAQRLERRWDSVFGRDFTDFTDLMPSPLCEHLLKLVDYQVQREELTALWMMLLHFEKYLDGPEHIPVIAQKNSIQSLDGLEHIFQGMVREQSQRECLEELARLTLLLVCADISRGTNKKFVEYLLEEFPNASRTRYQHLIPAVEFLDWSGVLVDAAGSLQQGLLEVLISHGANVNAATPKGTPLISAVAHGNVQNTRLLLQQGADVNKNCRKGTYGTALIAGCAVGDLEVLEVLLDIRDIEVNAVAITGTFATALIAACAHGRAKVVKKLLQKDVRVNKTVTTGAYATALLAAAGARCIQAVRLLLKNGAREVSEEDDEEDTNQGLADESDNDGVGRGESDSSEDDSDRNDTDWDSSDEDEDDSDDDDDDSDEDEDDNNEDSDEEDIINEHHAADADADVDEDNGNQEARVEEPTDDSNSILAETVRYITRRLNAAMSLDSLGTSQTLVASLGFPPYKHERALEKGFQELVKKTDGQDWRMVKDAWSEFLDLAEEAEEKELSDPLVDKLAKAEVRAVQRTQSFYELQPYSDEETEDEGGEEDTW